MTHTDLSAQKPGNRLGLESSPYLRQHADNPVHWYAWNQEALAAARRENKPILLSIGYAACHWCHVMAHESFEDQSTAEIMNRDFINIKVDREERPDLDEIYMKAVQMMTGHGGWPMTVFLTPDLKPFYGGTYFPPADRHGLPSFQKALSGVNRAWQEDRDQVQASSEKLTSYLKDFDRSSKQDVELNRQLEASALSQIMKIFDRQWGGLGNAPKFPHASCLELAMRYAAGSPADDFLAQDCQDFVKLTLDRMATGGMHDQIGGGFARYSVDRMWLVPHFEKMLYDNARLSRAYLNGYLLTGKQYYRQVARDCLDFVLNELLSPEGAFYSSLDADSEGEEGKFYAFNPKQIESVLGAEDGSWFNQVMGITPEGNFEHGMSVAHLTGSKEELAGRLQMSLEAFDERLDLLRKRVLDYRNRRVRPGLDQKILTSWNGLMIPSLALGYGVLQEEEYLQAAIKAAHFILEKMCSGNRLLRTFGGGEAKLNAYLEDYAFLVQALIDLASQDGDPIWLENAIALTDTMLAHFSDTENGGLYFTSDDHEELLTRPKNHFDGSIPSGTSVAAMNLLRLERLTGKEAYRLKAEEIFRLYAAHFNKMPDQFANLLCALDLHLSATSEIALLSDGKDKRWAELHRELNSIYLPDTQVLMVQTGKLATLPWLENLSLKDGRPTAFICRNFSCQEPVLEPEALAAALKSLVKLKRRSKT